MIAGEKKKSWRNFVIVDDLHILLLRAMESVSYFLLFLILLLLSTSYRTVILYVEGKLPRNTSRREKKGNIDLYACASQIDKIFMSFVSARNREGES